MAKKRTQKLISIKKPAPANSFSTILVGYKFCNLILKLLNRRLKFLALLLSLCRSSDRIRQYD